MLLSEEQFSEALEFLLPIADEKPSDRGVLRLLADLYYLTDDWASLQKYLPTYVALKPSTRKI